MTTTALQTGTPVTIHTGLPYEMTWEETDRHAGLEGVLTAIDPDREMEGGLVPFTVTCPDGITVSAQQVEPITDTGRALAVAQAVAVHAVQQRDAARREHQDDTLRLGGLLALIEEALAKVDLPQAVRAELEELTRSA